MKIVVRGTNWIGDAAMSVPAMRRLRGAFPDAEITLLTRPWAAGIFSDADFIDHLMTIPADASRVRSVASQIRQLRRRKFDIAVLLPNSFESAVVARLSGVPVVAGYRTDGRRAFLTNSYDVPEWKNSRHEVFYYLELVERVIADLGGIPAVPDTKPQIALPVSDRRIEEARNLLASFGIERGRRIIALAAGSKNSRAKRWGAANFAELGAMITRELGAAVVVIGSPEEADVAADVCSREPGLLTNLCGKTNLAEAAAVIAVADLLVANDMGLAHLAPAAGTPVVTIFGPTNSTTTRPFGDNSVVVSAEVECSPCMLRDCPIDHRCMTRVLPDAVYGTVYNILAETDK